MCLLPPHVAPRRPASSPPSSTPVSATTVTATAATVPAAAATLTAAAAPAIAATATRASAATLAAPAATATAFSFVTPLAHTDYFTFHQTRRRLLQRHAPRSPHGSRQRAAASSGGAQQPLARLLRVDMADAAATTEASGAGSAISSTHTGFPEESVPGNPRAADLVRLTAYFYDFAPGVLSYCAVRHVFTY